MILVQYGQNNQDSVLISSHDAKAFLLESVFKE